MTADAPPVLLETMRLENGVVRRLERHLTRMRSSAMQFGYPWPDRQVYDLVAATAAGHAAGIWRLRLLLENTGEAAATCTTFEDGEAVWRVAFANHPVDAGDPRLLHKTTDREPYDIARRGRPDVDDVLLWNERGEVTESTIANVVVEIDGARCTPPVTCGLLAGVLRGELLEAGSLTERVLSRGQVARAPRVWLVNSLRGWIEASVVR